MDKTPPKYRSLTFTAMLTSGIKSNRTFLLKLADRSERSANILEADTYLNATFQDIVKCFCMYFLPKRKNKF